MDFSVSLTIAQGNQGRLYVCLIVVLCAVLDHHEEGRVSQRECYLEKKEQFCRDFLYPYKILEYFLREYFCIEMPSGGANRANNQNFQPSA